MKKYWKSLLAILLLSGMLLVGCGKTGNGSGTSESTDGKTETDAPLTEEPLTLVRDGKSAYRITYPENADENVMRAAHAVRRALKSYTGADLEEVDDYLRKGDTPPEYEILIGDTNREESVGVKKELGGGEYTVRIVGKKLVILGGTSNSTEKAGDYFCDEIVAAADGLKEGTPNGTLTIRPEQNYTRKSQYNIRSLTIGGEGIQSYRLVVPKDGGLETYFAKLLKRHLALYTGFSPEIVTDETASADCEIRIGKTARTKGEATDGKATVAVSGKTMEILFADGFGFQSAYTLLTDQLFSNLQATIALKDGESWNANATAPENVAKKGEMRILYHNVWGYINADLSNPVSMRPDVALSIYQTYQPDILCLEECSGVYRNGATALFNWLNETYTEVCDRQYGTGNPIFFNKTLFEQVEWGYEKSREGDKGTTWVVLKRKSDGKLFAVANSHFAADTNAGDDPVKGNEYRTQDAQTMLAAVQSIVAKYGKISVFSGGDFNATQAEDPYAVLTGGGMTNVRALAEKCTDLSPYYGVFPYNSDYDCYPLQLFLTRKAAFAIDHFMLYGAKPTVHQYDVVNYALAMTASDHAPHFADVSLSGMPDFREGNSDDMTHIGFGDLFR